MNVHKGSELIKDASISLRSINMVKVIPIQGGPYDSNMFLVRGSTESVLIDAGTGLHGPSVIRKIRIDLAGSELAAVVLTHEHIDHSGGAQGLREEFGSPIYCSRECAEILKVGNPAMTGSILFGIKPESVSDINILEPVLEVDGLRFEVKDTPGHCRGQVALIEERTRSLFCGDLVFCDGGVGRWDLPGGDLKKHQDSIRRSLEWDVSSLHPGHGRSEWSDPLSEMKLAYSMIEGIR
ncbi:MAG: MBL fold metallo-hydrolase [Thermoplasmatota archaeon]